MHPAFKTAVALDDVAEPADPSVARVVIGDYDETEPALGANSGCIVKLSSRPRSADTRASAAAT